MIKNIIIFVLLLICVSQCGGNDTKAKQIELKAMDNFFDKLLQNATPIPLVDKQCLKYEDCPKWDGNPDTKMYYDLMKGLNGSGKIEKSDFNWNVHLYLCHQNKLLDSINGEGAFERLAIISAKDGMIPCPIDNNPHWNYDWENHILKARAEAV
jgi:hypothetical protein|tara:strand:- start:294 stop:755 length:462 start_codon:yes stop_codon:yes gene_type:complete